MKQSRTAAFGAHSTADDVLEGLDLDGKTVLVTGGSSGLGAESAGALAARGAHVIVTARQPEKASALVESIRDRNGVEVRVEALELGSLASVRATAERLSGVPFDALILNAGVMSCPAAWTEDGYEQQFAVNHLGHFLLTARLAPQIRDGGRVVVVSSVGHQISPVVFDDIHFKQREYDRWAAYGQSKSANALFAVALQSRLAGRGIDVFAVHPGAIPTDLERHLTADELAYLQAEVDSGKVFRKTVPQGAATQVLAATAPELSGTGGAYLVDCAPCPVDDEASSHQVVRSYALDPSKAERLWTVSEDMVGETF